MSTKKKLLEAAAGNAGEAVYVDDVFSTYLYTGNGSTQNITNGIDLANEGGMVWIKNRDAGRNHFINDTERGAERRLQSNSTNAEYNTTAGGNSGLASFNSNGFTLGNDTDANANVSNEYASWTFRKQPGFFDIVTYTGNGSARTISHNLDATVGMLIVKNLSQSGSWFVYHLGAQGVGGYDADELVFKLDTDASRDNQPYWNNTAPTSSVFSVGSGLTNTSGDSYVAYLFAHDAQEFGTDSDESIIKCGSYTGTGSSGLEVDVGFEPQWLLVKAAGLVQDWFIFDMMRPFTANSSNGGTFLRPNLSDAELALDSIGPTSSGFKVYSNNVNLNSNTEPYIYVAIRRPHKPAEEFAATDLFAINTRGTVPNQGAGYRSGFVTDFAIRAYLPGGSSAYPMASSRISGAEYITTSATNAAISQSSQQWDFMDGYYQPSSANTDTPSFMFRRAPGFFDVVAYTGTGATLTLDHNLSVAPEFMIVKGRTINAGWHTYHKDVGNTKALPLNSNGAESTSSFYWNNTSPTDTQVTLGAFSHYNVNNQTGILYLFATVPGISKVGSYTGTGSNVDVNCGFTSGARFVLVKRTDSTGDWYLWDSARGIVAGNDPYLLLNSNAAQVTSTDYIDPLSSGFTVTSTAPAALNASGGTYIFLAIA